MWELVRLSTRPVLVLAQPSVEVLRWPEEQSPQDEEDLAADPFTTKPLQQVFKDELCQELSRWLGWGACAFSSWEDTCRRIADAPATLVRHLNSTMFASAKSTCRARKVEPKCLHGYHGPEIADVSWWKRFLTSYVESNYDHTGRTTSTTTANVDPAMAHNLGRPPGLSAFVLPDSAGENCISVQAEIESLKFEAEQRGDVYLVLLDQRYNCQQQNPPQGKLTWRSCSILLWMEMESQSYVTAQLAMVDLDGGEVEITATNLAGNEISSWKGWLEQETFAGLKDAIARQSGHPASDIKMILPSGELLGEDMLAKKLDAVLKGRN